MLAPHPTVHFGDRVSILNEKLSGVLCSPGISDSRLHIQQAAHDKVPVQFEYAVFQLERVKTWLTQFTGGFHDEPIMFGNLLQLKHVSSGKVVCVHRIRKGTSRPSFHVRLEEAGDSSSVFRVMPRYKIRQEGERVIVGDHLVLFNEHLKVYLALQGTMICGSSVPGAFSFNLYETATAHSPDALCAGKCILIFHKEQESFLSLISEKRLQFIYPLIQDSTYNIASLQYSSNSLWIVEGTNPTEGGRLALTPELYRLKHIATQKYLGIDPTDGAFTFLTELSIQSIGEDFSLWCFHPCDPTEKNISSSSTFFRLLNFASNMWLHACNSDIPEPMTPQQSNTFLEEGVGSGITQLPSFSVSAYVEMNLGDTQTVKLSQNKNRDTFSIYSNTWGTSHNDPMSSGSRARENTEATASNRAAYVDVFCAVSVVPTVHKNLELILGNRLTLQALATLIRTSKSTQGLMLTSEFSESITSLEHLIPFCTQSEITDVLKREGRPKFENQNMLFEQKLHLVVLDIIVSTFGSRSKLTALTIGCSHLSPRQDLSALQFGVEGDCVLPFQLAHESGGAAYKSYRHLLALCFRFLKLVLKGNLQLCSALWEYFAIIGKFIEIVPVSCGVLEEAALLRQLPKKIIMSVGPKCFQNFTRDVCYVQLLSVLCMEGGYPLPDYQHYLQEMMLKSNTIVKPIIADNSMKTIPNDSNDNLLGEEEERKDSVISFQLGAKTFTLSDILQSADLQNALLGTMQLLSHAFLGWNNKVELLPGASEADDPGSCLTTVATTLNEVFPLRAVHYLLSRKDVSTVQRGRLLRACIPLAQSHFSAKPQSAGVQQIWLWNKKQSEDDYLPTADKGNISLLAAEEDIKKLTLQLLRDVIVDFNILTESVVLVNDVLILWNVIAKSGAYSQSERQDLVHIIDGILKCIPSPRHHKDIQNWSEKNVRLMECVQHALNLLNALLDHSAFSSAFLIRRFIVDKLEDPDFSPDEDFGEEDDGKGGAAEDGRKSPTKENSEEKKKQQEGSNGDDEKPPLMQSIRELCYDNILCQKKWIGSLFEMATFEQALLANNALTTIFRILSPATSILPQLACSIAFTEEAAIEVELVKICNYCNEIEELVQPLLTTTARSVSSFDSMQASLVLEQLKFAIEDNSSSDDLIADVQGVLLQHALHTSMLEMLSWAAKVSGEDAIFLDIGVILLFLTKNDNEMAIEALMPRIDVILGVTSSPKAFTAPQYVALMEVLFQRRVDLSLDMSNVVIEYFSPKSHELRAECLRCLNSIVKNTSGATQRNILTSISAATLVYENIFELKKIPRQVIVAFVELLVTCYLRQPSSEFAGSSMTLKGLLEFGCGAERDASVITSLLHAAAQLFLTDIDVDSQQGQGVMITESDAVVVVNAVFPRIEEFCLLPFEPSQWRVEIFHFLNNLMKSSCEKAKRNLSDRFSTLATHVVSILSEKSASSNPASMLPLKLTAEIALFLDATEEFVAPKQIPQLPELHFTFCKYLEAEKIKNAMEKDEGEKRDEGNERGKNSDDKKEKNAIILKNFIALRTLFRRELATPSEEGLKPLTALLLTEDGSDLMQITTNHLRLTKLEDWVTICLLISLETMLRLAMERSEASLVALQNKLNSFGATPLISTLLEKQTYDVVKYSIRFGIGVLQGGNKKCQDALLNYFNTHDEKFFLTTRQFLKVAKQEISAKQSLCSKEPTLSKHAISMTSIVEDVCRLLQLLCEGHHFDFQNYVRHQHDNFNSYNMCALVMEILHAVIKRLDSSSISIAIQALNTLTEFCQGPCPLNQAAIVQCNVVSEVNRILSSSFDGIDSEDVMQMKCASVIALLSLLEGSQDATIPNLMLNTIHIDELKSLLELVWFERDKDPTLLELGFNVYILASVLIAEGDEMKAVHLKKLLQETPGHAFFQTQVCKIEIWRDDDEKFKRLETVYFRKPEICKLRPETREQVLNSVNRSSLIAKHSDFFQQADDLIFEMEYQFVIEQYAATLPRWKNPFQLATCQPRPVEETLLALSLLSNTLLMAGYQTRDGSTSIWSAIIFFLIAISQLACCTYLIGVRFVLRLPLIAHRKCSALSQEDPFLQLSSLTEKLAHACSYSNVMQVLTETYTLFFMFFIGASLLAIFNSAYYNCFLLLMVTHKFPLLANIVTAITMNGRQLLLTAFLGAIMVYFFTVAGFLFFHDHFMKDESLGGGSHCETLRECFFFTFGKGVRGGGGISDLLIPNEWKSEEFFLRESYDTLFFVVVGVIIMNIIFALIVDTFAELRDERTKIEDDMATTCFICGIDNATFEREGERFRDHTKGPHNQWRYLYFMHHLRRKDCTEFTGQESYVYAKMAKRDLSFFPVNKSKSLDKKALVTGNTEEEQDREEEGVRRGGGTDFSLADIRQTIEEVMTVQLKELKKRQVQSGGISSGHPTTQAASLWEKAKKAHLPRMASFRGGVRSPGGSPTKIISRPSTEDTTNALLSPIQFSTSGNGAAPNMEEFSMANLIQSLVESRMQVANVTKQLEGEMGK